MGFCQVKGSVIDLTDLSTCEIIQHKVIYDSPNCSSSIEKLQKSLASSLSLAKRHLISMSMSVDSYLWWKPMNGNKLFLVSNDFLSNGYRCLSRYENICR